MTKPILKIHKNAHGVFTSSDYVELCLILDLFPRVQIAPRITL